MSGIADDVRGILSAIISRKTVKASSTDIPSEQGRTDRQRHREIVNRRQSIPLLYTERDLLASLWR